MAMMILQVVGHQNSGKTTLIEKCIKELTNHGIKVGTFKHHGHGGKPDIPKKIRIGIGKLVLLFQRF